MSRLADCTPSGCFEEVSEARGAVAPDLIEKGLVLDLVEPRWLEYLEFLLSEILSTLVNFG
jgi:hypothetical protein